MVAPVGLTIVLEVATEVGGAGALIADVEGPGALDPVVTGAVVVDDIAPGGAVVPGGPRLRVLLRLQSAPRPLRPPWLLPAQLLGPQGPPSGVDPPLQIPQISTLC
jgi:hypothetical protein